MINILFTSAGGKFTYDIVTGLKLINKNIRIIGVDSNPDIKKPFYFDSFEKVPRADILKKKYINRILSLSKKYNIKIIMVNSENECLAISSHHKLFSKKKIYTSVGDYKTVSLMTDKFKMMKFLNKYGLETGKFMKISSLDEAEFELFSMGYPKKKIILKQRYGSGSRGIFVINSQTEICKELLSDRLCLEGNWNIIKDQIKLKLGSLDNFLIMPFYNGDTFDVDCVCNKGELINCCIRKRIYNNPFSPTNEGCQIVTNKIIYNYIKKIVKILNIDKACDFDITLDDKKKPKILDASSRISGSVGASIVGGNNILLDLMDVIQNKNKNRNKKKGAKEFKSKIFPVIKFLKV